MGTNNTIDDILYEYFKDRPEYTFKTKIMGFFIGELLPLASKILITLSRYGHCNVSTTIMISVDMDYDEVVDLVLDAAKELEDKIKSFTFKED